MSNENDLVQITKKELENLRADAALLQRLDAAGVDNWEGYHYAYSDELFDMSYDEVEEQIASEVAAMNGGDTYGL